MSICMSVYRNVYFGQLPRHGQPPKPIEFVVDQAMVIRLISLMSKLLKVQYLENGTRQSHKISHSYL